jgi:hypothetical protein
MENHNEIPFEENISKLPPLSVSLWNTLGKSKGRIKNCYTCDIIPLDKKDCYTWYKNIPSENIFDDIDNLVLVCECCKNDMLKKKKYADFYKKRYCKKKKIEDEYSYLDEIDNWDVKFGTEKSTICEICNTTVLYKNKSNYTYIKYENEDLLKIQCINCFLEKIREPDPNELIFQEEYNLMLSKNKEYIPSNIVNINDIDECIYKTPSRFYLWELFTQEKRKKICPICDKKLSRRYSFSWYYKLPKEGGSQDLNNFTLVCIDCNDHLYTKKKGIESYKKYVSNKNNKL